MTDGIKITEGEGGRHHRVELMVDGRSVSCAWIVHLTIRVGCAPIRMDGIGGVGTGDEYRNRGYSRRVLEYAVDWMVDGDAAISMLYGIPDYYHKFGYATAGPDHSIRLPLYPGSPALPAGWGRRPAAEADLCRLKSLYGICCQGEVGSSVRRDGAYQWQRLADAVAARGEDACLVAVSPAGVVEGYAWQVRGVWSTGVLERDDAGAVHFGEAMATSIDAATSVLAAAHGWAREHAGDRTELRLSVPHDGVVAQAAARCDAEFRTQHCATGGSMARVLDLRRLLDPLLPELSARLAAARHPYHGCVRIATDMGDADLAIGPGGVGIAPAGSAPDLVVSLPQQDLARLVLGAFAPRSLASVQAATPSAADLLAVLFPQRCPHMHLADRY